jgi:hypothetical protein
MPLDLSGLAPQVEEKWKIHPRGTKTPKPPTSRKSSGEVGGFSARDTGFEPVAFGSGGVELGDPSDLPLFMPAHSRLITEGYCMSGPLPCDPGRSGAPVVRARSSHFPGCPHLRAMALDRLGRKVEAREVVSDQLRVWARAAPRHSSATTDARARRVGSTFERRATSALSAQMAEVESCFALASVGTLFTLAHVLATACACSIPGRSRAKNAIARDVLPDVRRAEDAPRSSNSANLRVKVCTKHPRSEGLVRA